MNIYWTDLKRFLVNSFKKLILLSTLLIVVIIGLIYIYKNNSNLDAAEESVENEFNDMEDSKEAYFRFYIENHDGEYFNNAKIIDELFNLDETYVSVKNNTGIDLLKLVEKQDLKEKEDLNEKEEESQDSSKTYQPVIVKVDSSSNIITATFETGNSDKNLEIAEFYRNYLFTEEMEILKNKTVYSIEAIKLFDGEENNDNTEIEKTSSNKFSVIDGFIAVALGVTFSFLFIFSKELFSRKLNYSFSYNTGDPDYFIVYDLKDENSTYAEQFVKIPFDHNRITLCENNLKNIKEMDAYFLGELKITNSLSNLDKDTQIDEIIIKVISKHTSRQWYNQQLELAKLWGVPVKVIQINPK